VQGRAGQILFPLFLHRDKIFQFRKLLFGVVLILFPFRKIHITDLECFVQIADLELHLALRHLYGFLYCFGFRCFHSGSYLMDSFPDFASYKIKVHLIHDTVDFGCVIRKDHDLAHLRVLFIPDDHIEQSPFPALTAEFSQAVGRHGKELQWLVLL